MKNGFTQFIPCKMFALKTPTYVFSIRLQQATKYVEIHAHVEKQSIARNVLRISLSRFCLFFFSSGIPNEVLTLKEEVIL